MPGSNLTFRSAWQGQRRHRGDVVRGVAHRAQAAVWTRLPVASLKFSPLRPPKTRPLDGAVSSTSRPVRQKLSSSKLSSLRAVSSRLLRWAAATLRRGPAAPADRRQLDLGSWQRDTERASVVGGKCADVAAGAVPVAPRDVVSATSPAENRCASGWDGPTCSGAVPRDENGRRGKSPAPPRPPDRTDERLLAERELRRPLILRGRGG